MLRSRRRSASAEAGKAGFGQVSGFGRVSMDDRLIGTLLLTHSRSTRVMGGTVERGPLPLFFADVASGGFEVFWKDFCAGVGRSTTALATKMSCASPW